MNIADQVKDWLGRRRQVRVAGGENDYARWGNPRAYDRVWDRRAEIAAAWISKPASQVVDIGCGPMRLKEVIQVPVTYVPADLNPWLPGVLKIDLNADQYPEGRFDYAVMLGVIEYLRDPVRVLRAVRLRAQYLITSYCVRIQPGSDSRTARGWINHMDEHELDTAFTQSGWTPRETRPYEEAVDFRQRLFFCEQAAPSE